MPRHTSISHQNRLKIIGGNWRGRTFSFPAALAIRPTPNRVRETLFNWLAPIIRDANCLDLFAGSGALGFEALSRGASAVTLVDRDLSVVQHLKQTAGLLHTEKASVFCLEIPSSAFFCTKPFNVVFLDPPFTQNLIGPCCEWLQTQRLLAEDAYVYIEAEKNLKSLPVPSGWELLKSKIAGQVSYHLLKV
jgi:16S rRNA (guanine966-N2)-methyltransferase